MELFGKFDVAAKETIGFGLKWNDFHGGTYSIKYFRHFGDSQ